jgi:hypothetical protein
MKTYKHDLMGKMIKLKSAKSEYTKAVSPFTYHRHSEAKYNYIHRNLQECPDCVPLQHKKDKLKGHFVDVQIPHRLKAATSAPESVIPASTTGNGFIPTVLGTVYGL